MKNRSSSPSLSNDALRQMRDLRAHLDATHDDDLRGSRAWVAAINLKSRMPGALDAPMASATGPLPFWPSANQAQRHLCTKIGLLLQSVVDLDPKWKSSDTAVVSAAAAILTDPSTSLELGVSLEVIKGTKWFILHLNQECTPFQLQVCESPTPDGRSHFTRILDIGRQPKLTPWRQNY